MEKVVPVDVNKMFKEGEKRKYIKTEVLELRKNLSLNKDEYLYFLENTSQTEILATQLENSYVFMCEGELVVMDTTTFKKTYTLND